MNKLQNGVDSRNQSGRRAADLAGCAGLASAISRVGGWTAAIATTVIASFTGQALAGPEGAKVVRGDVKFQRNGDNTVITAGRNAIINYRSFDIAAHESVRFQQPDAKSRVLNRIESNRPTRIDGSLTANGRVYFINPAGVFFGQSAVVDVAGLYAAAGQITDADFVKGTDRFTNLSGQVVNHGRITSDFVGLIGKQVANTGSIVAPQGTVVMASGEDVLVGERQGNIFVRVSGEAAGTATQAATENTGQINAQGGRVRMVAGDVVALAVRTTGTVKAASTVIEGQGSGVVSAEGVIDASNQGRGGKGGEVKVLGERVALDGATINASGANGGGTILVGGNYQGRGPERNAESTFVTSDSTITANATHRGDGGTIVVWADGTTRYYGNLSATGGAQGGNGGMAEVSGKEYLLFAGGAKLGAPKGVMGTLLLDPRDITVQTTGADDGELDGDQVTFGEPNTTTDITLSAATIEAIDANVTLQASRDIFINAAISMANNGRSLTLQAGDDITVSAALTTRGANINLTANDAGGPASGTGDIFINAALNTTGNSQVGGAINLTVSGGTGAINIGADLTTANANITLTGPVLISGAGVDMNTTTTTGGDKVVGFSSTLGLGGNDLSITSDEIDFTGNVSGAGTLTLRGASANQPVQIGGSAATNRLDLTTAEVALFQASLTGLNVGRADGTSSVSFGAATTFATALSVQAGGNITVGNTISGTSVTLQSDQNVDVSADITASTAIVLHGDFDDSGNASDDVIFSAAGVDLNSASISLFAGDQATGTGSNTATVDANSSNVTFRGAGGGATNPTSFTVRQDAAIANADLAATSNFGAAFSGLIYTLRSDASTVSVTTAANVNGSALTLNGTSVTFGDTGNVTTLASFLSQANTTLQGDLRTTGGTITFEQGLTVTGSRGLDSTNNGGNATGATISLNTVSGNTTATAGTDQLFFNAGTAGNVVLNGSVGTSGTRFALVQITDANNVSLAASQTIFATQITQSAGQGTTTLTGNLNSTTGGTSLNGNIFSISGTMTGTTGLVSVTGNTVTVSGLVTGGAGGVSLFSGGALNLSGGVTTSAGGTLTVSSAGLFTLSTTDLTLDGAFNKNGAGNTSLGRSISTTNDAISFNAGTTTLAANNLSLSSGTATITMGAMDVNGQNFTLTGDEIDFTGTVTNTVSGVGTLTLRNASVGTTITTGGGTDATANVLEISAADLANFSDEDVGAFVIGRTDASSSNITAAGTFNDAVTFQTAAGGNVSVTGTLRGAQSDASITFTTGAFNLGGTVQTAGSLISLSSPVVLTGGGGTLDTTDAGAVTTGGNISITSAVTGTTDGAQALFINAGTAGNVVLSQAIGTSLVRLAAFQITQANDVTAANIFSRTITLSNSAGTATFNGVLDTADTVSGGNDILLNGTIIAVNGGAITANSGNMLVGTTGQFTIGSSGVTLDGSFTKNGAGATSLNGDVVTTDDNVTFNGNVTVASSGRSILTGSNVVNANNNAVGIVDFNNGLDLNGNGLTIRANGIDFGGTNSVTSTVAGVGTLRLAGGFDTTTIGVGTGATGTLVLDATDLGSLADEAAATIIIGGGTTSSAIAITGATFRDAVQFTTTGVISNSTAQLLGNAADASFTFSGSSISLGADVATAGAAITFSSPVTLAAGVLVDSTNAGGTAAGNDILFSGAVSGNQALTINAGTSGNLTHSGTVSGLTTYTVTNSDAISTQAIGAGVISITNTVGGTANYAGALSTTAAGGISLLGGAHTLNAGATTTNSGTFSASGSGDLAINTTALSLDGAFSRTGTGTTSLGANISTSNDNITFNAGQVTMTAAGRQLSSGTGTVSIGGGGLEIDGQGLTIVADEIDFGAAITGDGTSTLTLVGATVDTIEIGQSDDLNATVLELSDTDLANLSDEAFGNLVIGDTSLTANILVDSSTFRDAVQFVTNNVGAVTVIGDVLGSNADASLTLDGEVANLFANLRTAGATITVNSDTLLLGASAIDTTNVGAVSAGANITLNGVVIANTGTESLTLNAGTGGNILASADIGDSTTGRLGAFVITNANDVTTQDIFAASIQQVAGSGLSNFTGVLNSNGAGGIALTGNDFTIAGGAVTTGNAAMAVDHAGLLTISTTALTLDGAFTETSTAATGTVDLLTNITTTGDNVIFNRAVTIASGTSTITTAGGDITFNSTLDGAGSAALNAAAGTINLNDDVGAGTPLASLTLTAGQINQGGTVTVGTLGYTSDGDIVISDDVTATGFSTHSGTDGTGNTSFGTGVDINANTISFRAGDGFGGSTVAFVDSVTNSPTFRSAAGGATSPTSFSIRQDAGIADTGIAAASQFAGGISGLAYSLTSDDGAVTVSTASKVAGTNLTLSGGTGAAILADLNLASLNVLSGLTLGGDVVTTAGGITISGATFTSGSHELDAGTNTVALNGGGVLGTDDLTITGDEIDLGAALSGTGNLTLRSSTLSRNIVLGGASAGADLDLTAAELGQLGDGFASITIGRAIGTGLVSTAGAVTFLDPVSILAGGGAGAIAINHTLTGISGASILLNSGTGGISLGADVFTEANTISFEDSVTLTNSVTIDSTNGGAAVAGADITFAGNIAADLTANAHDLSINAGTAGLAAVAGVVGLPERIANFTVTGAIIEVTSVLTTGNQTYNGPLTFNGSLGSLGAGTITVNGMLILAGDGVIATGGGAPDGITINGAITGMFPGLSLVMDAGVGSLSVAGNIGTPNTLLNFSASGAANTFGGNITTTGTQTYTGNSTITGDLTGTSIVFNNNADITGQINSTTLSITGDSIIVGNVTTSGTQTYTGASTITGDLSGTDITFGNNATVNGLINSSTLAITGTSNLTGNVTTTGTQTYTGASTIVGDLSGTDITFGNNATVSGLINSSTLAITGTSNLTGNVTTTGTQTYTGASTIVGDLSGTDLIFGNNATITGQVNSTTLAITGVSTISGNVTTTGTQTYTGPATILGDLTGTDLAFGNNADITGQINSTTLSITGDSIIAGNVTTSGTQAYTGPSTITGDLSGTDITFGNNATVNGLINSTTLAITGTSNLTGNVTTTGAQTYTGASTITGNVSGTTLAWGSSANILGNISGATISVGGPATITGNVTGTGITFSNTLALAGNVTGDTVAVNGGLTLSTDSTFTGTTSVAFNDFVRSQTGLGRGLSVVSPATTFIGTVGAGAGNELGFLTTDAGGTVTVQSGTINVLNAINFGDAMTITNDLVITSTNAGVTFVSTVGSDGTPRALTVNDAANATTQFLAAVGGSPLASLTTNSGGTVELHGNITTTGAVSFGDRVRLFADPTITAGSVLFASTLDSQPAGLPRALTINATGGVTFADDVGTTDILQFLVVSAGAVEAGNVTTRGSQTYTGLMTLNGTLESTLAGSISIASNLLVGSDSSILTAGTATDNITLSGTVDSVGAPAALTLAGGGAITIGGEVGRSVIANQFALSSFNVTGSSITMRGARTVGNQFYTGPTSINGNFDVTGSGAIAFSNALTLLADSIMTTTNGGVTFGSTVDATSTNARSLDVRTGGGAQTRFSGIVGGTHRLTNLSTNADGTTRIDGGSVRVTGDAVFSDAVLLGSTTTFEGNSVRFLGTLNGVNGNAIPNLVVNTAAAGQVAFGGAVGQNDPLGTIVTSAASTVLIGANMRTTSGMTFTGPVSLTGNSIIDGGSGTLFFRSTINADAAANNRTLTLLSTATSDIDTPAFRFGGSIGATQRLRGFTLGADRTSAASAATAVFSDGFDSNGKILASSFQTTDAFTIGTGTDGFTMGRGQKITAFGALTINSDGTARVGDLTSLTDLFINAPTVVLRLRGSGPVVERDPNNPGTLRTITDTGLDMVAKGTIRVRDGASISIDNPGGFSQPLFANDSGIPSSSALGQFTHVKLAEPLAISQFIDPRNNLSQVIGFDGRANGEAGGLPSDVAGAIPRVQERREAATPVSIGQAQKELLREMGIPAQDVPTEMLLEFLVGRSIYQDQVTRAKPRIDEGRDYQVTVNRLRPDDVQAAVDSYVALIGDPIVDDSGNQKYDADGKPLYNSRASEIKVAVAESFEAYAETLDDPDAADGVGFRAWLESRGSEASDNDKLTLDSIRRYSVFVEKIDALGLSPFEASVPKDRVFGEIFPNGLLTQMREAVFGKQVSLVHP